MNHQLTWARFEEYNLDAQTAFENMCRLLFNCQYFEGKAILRSSPNHPGIEVDPILEPKTQKRISFQAKFISTPELAYRQILSSMKTAVKHYAGLLDKIILYCKCDLTDTSKPYKDICKLLSDNSIELEVVSNQAVLDSILLLKSTFPCIAEYYFNSPSITRTWFQQKLEISLDDLGKRFNKNFNVNVPIEEQLSLFCLTEQSIARINERKQNAVDTLNSVTRESYNYKGFISSLTTAINSIPNTEFASLSDSIKWKERVHAELQTEFDSFVQNLSEKEQQREVLQRERNEMEQDSVYRGITTLSHEISLMRKILSAFEELTVSEDEARLIECKSLMIDGEAGIGKSQLLGNVATGNMMNGELIILLLGQTFISKDPITTQIAQHIGLSQTFDELVNVLEGFGWEQGKCVTLFIDAINESANSAIWQTGLVSLIHSLDNLKHVKLVLSVRSEFVPNVISDTIAQKIRDNKVARLTHVGFWDDPIAAVMKFFDYYKIPFRATDFLRYELSNPLMLTLFCEAGNTGHDQSSIFDAYISKIETEICRKFDLIDIPLVVNFSNQVADKLIATNGYSIAISELGKFDYCGLPPANVISHLCVAGFIMKLSSDPDSEPHYTFAYDKLMNYICAKRIMSMFDNADESYAYITTRFLKIDNGKIVNFFNQSVLYMLFGLYPEKFGVELCSLIDSISDSFDKEQLIKEYIKSYGWRKPNSINRETFMAFALSHEVPVSDLFETLLNNALVTDHPLNARFLHDLLMPLLLKNRDYLWTIFINTLTEEDRVYYLVKHYQKGNEIANLQTEEYELLGITFAWLLTASSRQVRDNASRALIEILKTRFSLCEFLLTLFSDVNDPYVLQRLYGCVFGACMKRRDTCEKEYTELAINVYNTVFNQEMVYPDILLRDYAKLILERYLFEFGNESANICIDSITPPYNSEPIPKVTLFEEKRVEGEYKIVWSMRPEGCGGVYGYFGRYTFQSSLSDFEKIDIPNLYSYAMHFIFEELGYNNEQFESYDNSYDVDFERTHHGKRKERIGKKYEWIAYYNILARVADHHMLKGEDYYSDKKYQTVRNLKSTAEPFMRDFDPTLNAYFMKNPSVPHFINESEDAIFVEWSDSSKYSSIREWADTGCDMFSNLSDNLLITDADGGKWISLYHYRDAKSKDDMFSTRGDTRGEEVWNMAFALFARASDVATLHEVIESSNFNRGRFPEGRQLYCLFNREYAWSSDVEDVCGEEWESFQTSRESDSSFEVLPAYQDFLWESENDMIKSDFGDSSVSYTIPCNTLIRGLNLSQQTCDGYYYDKKGVLVAFDSRIDSLGFRSALFRKEYLDSFLTQNGYALFWAVIGEKQHFGGFNNQEWSEWNGLYIYEDSCVTGSMHLSAKPEPDEADVALPAGNGLNAAQNEILERLFKKYSISNEPYSDSFEDDCDDESDQ
jgi:hypothetical protein